jgi:hypothetical protein
MTPIRVTGEQTSDESGCNRRDALNKARSSQHWSDSLGPHAAVQVMAFHEAHYSESRSISPNADVNPTVRIVHTSNVVNGDAIRDSNPIRSSCDRCFFPTVPEAHGIIFVRRNGGRVRIESVPNLIQAPDLEKRVAILRKKAEQVRLMLPTDVALYIAQNVRSNASALETALIRLMAHSSVTATEITLKYTRQVLANFIAAEARKVTVDPLRKVPSQPFGTKEAEIRCHLTATNHFVFCLLKTRDGRKTSRVRHELEVNMRESERDRLARRDAYERELEHRAKKRVLTLMPNH